MCHHEFNPRPPESCAAKPALWAFSLGLPGTSALWQVFDLGRKRQPVPVSKSETLSSVSGVSGSVL